MPDHVYDTIQMGRQAAVGTAGTVDFVFPAKGGEPELDRGYNNPDEDHGGMTDTIAGRGSWGVRGASTSIEADLRFEDVMHLLEMHVGGTDGAGVVIGGGPGYTYTHTSDETSDTLVPYTIEMGSEVAQDQYQLLGCVIPELTLGFDALTAPGNAPWRTTANIIALNSTMQAKTAGCVPPSTLETAEGHLTQLFEGATGTAFASLSELAASLVSFSLTSSRPLVGRAYGAAATDKAVAYGLSSRAGVTFEAGIKIAAGSKADMWDIFTAAASSPITERRWRIKANGASLVTQNEIQALAYVNTPTGGTWTLTFDGATTAALAYNISKANLQTAIRGLPTVGGAHATVGDTDGGPYTVTFDGNLAAKAQTLIQTNGALLTGAGAQPYVTATQTQPGGLLKSMTLDMRVRFTNITRGDRDGESIYMVQGVAVKDATTGTRLKVTTINGVSTIA